MAEAAYAAVQGRGADSGSPDSESYASFARSFPSLVHACGLAQAVAFACTRDHGRHYLDDLATVLNSVGHAGAASAQDLAQATRAQPVPCYMRLSRNAQQAAGWLKRYVDAVRPE